MGVEGMEEMLVDDPPRTCGQPSFVVYNSVLFSRRVLWRRTETRLEVCVRLIYKKVEVLGKRETQKKKKNWPHPMVSITWGHWRTDGLLHITLPLDTMLRADNLMKAMDMNGYSERCLRKWSYQRRRGLLPVIKDFFDQVSGPIRSCYF